MDEEWREIPGTDGWYEVSNLGRVRSWKNNKHGRLTEPKILRPGMGKGPRQYLGVRIDRGTGYRTHKIHTMVAEVFLGPRPEGLHICHGDGNPFNNAATNLRYDEPKANAFDKRDHGTQRLGSSHPGSRLTDDVVTEIRAALAEGESIRRVAKQYGVSASTIGDIKTGRTWSHLA